MCGEYWACVAWTKCMPLHLCCSSGLWGREGTYRWLESVGGKCELHYNCRVRLSKRWSIWGEGRKDVLLGEHQSQAMTPVFLFSSCSSERGSDPDLLSRNLESYHLLCRGLYFHSSSVFSWLDTSFFWWGHSVFCEIETSVLWFRVVDGRHR